MRRGGGITLRSIEVARRAVFFRFGVDGLTFSTTYWYEDVDFHALSAQCSEEDVQRLVFHSALFELNKLCSLRPDRIDLGDYARFLTPELEELWRTVFRKVWAQWRYEHDDPSYDGPGFSGRARGVAGALPIRPARASPGRPEVDTLAFCGGGKDSLVAMRLLERTATPYDAFVYSSSIYGRAEPQHARVDALVQRCRPRRRLRHWVFDDFLDSPVLELHPELGLTTLAAAETPSSVFGALPVALQHGYRGLCLCHERSADVGQVIWPATGEDVNHQWGKSFEAESLLNRYIQRSLLEEVRYYSLLKPIYDVVVFGLTRRHLEDVPFTHSCNVRKPWCLECPKCLYVWLGFAAFLPRERVRATFGTDALLESPSRVPAFAQLLGVRGARPFECVGHSDEVKIYLAACAAKGYRGPVIDLFLRHRPAPSELMPLVERYLGVDLDRSAIPSGIRGRVGAELAEAARETGDYLRALLETNDATCADDHPVPS